MVKDDFHRTRGLYYNNVEIPIDRHGEGFKLITRIPVSYTHLDVYKRQGYDMILLKTHLEKGSFKWNFGIYTIRIKNRQAVQ